MFNDNPVDPAIDLVLVQWEGLPPEDATWMNCEEIRGSWVFEDKDSFNRERDDMHGLADIGHESSLGQRPQA